MDGVMKSVWNWIGLTLAVVASGYLLFAPAYATTSSDIVLDSGGAFPQGASGGYETLASANGSSVYVLLAIPVLLAAIPLFGTRRSHGHVLGTIATVLLGAFAVVSLATIGLFYFPAVSAMVVGTLRAWVWHERVALASNALTVEPQ